MPIITLAGHDEPTGCSAAGGLSGPGSRNFAPGTKNWPKRMVERLAREYVRARWPMGEPDNFSRLFGIARVYMTLRWLGDPDLASPSIRRSIFSRRSKRLSIRSQNLVRKYRRFIEELHSEGE